VERRSQDGTAWLEVQVPANGQRAYLPLRRHPASALRSIALGKRLLEIVAEPMASDLPDLLDPAPITRALEELSSEGRAVRWVSVAGSADTCSVGECLDRRSRLNHAIYLLHEAGISPRVVTAVSDAQDLHGNGIRIRIFGQ
jgi:hypothetical protein